MDKTVKNVLAAFGAFAMVKAAPVFALGAAIGAVVSNREKVTKAAEDLVGRVEAELAKYGVVYPEDKCECCNGGACTCECECDCDTEDEPDQVSEDAEAPVEDAEPASWEEEVPGVEEEEAPPAEEPEAGPASEDVDKMEELRAKGEAALAALKALAEAAMR